MSDIRLLRVNKDGRASFSASGESVLQVGGLAALSQTVVNHLLTTPGSDVLNKKRGAGLSDLCRRYRTNSKDLQEKIADRIQKVNTQIKDEQRQLALPPAERLEDLTLISATPDEENPSRLDIIVGIQSKASERARVSI